MTRSLIVRHVEVRTWPERADVVVIDQDLGLALSHYRLDDIPVGAEQDALFSPLAPFATRADCALRTLEYDQDRLRLHWGVPSHASVRLAATDEPRVSLNNLLGLYGLDLDAVELGCIDDLTGALNRMDPTQLWALMCDWFDRAERRFRPGASREQRAAWAMRAHPDRADQFTAVSGDPDLAYEMYRESIDVPVAEFRLHQVLQWVFYARTEFRDRDCPAPAALIQLRG